MRSLMTSTLLETKEVLPEQRLSVADAKIERYALPKKQVCAATERTAVRSAPQFRIREYPI